MAFSYTKLASILIVCLAVAVPAAVEGFTCDDISKNLLPCAGFLVGGPGPTPDCCGAVTALVGMASTPADHQKSCGCLKQAAGAIAGFNWNNAAALPGKCGVTVSFPISPDTDCSKVQ